MHDILGPGMKFMQDYAGWDGRSWFHHFGDYAITQGWKYTMDFACSVALFDAWTLTMNVVCRLSLDLEKFSCKAGLEALSIAERKGT